MKKLVEALLENLSTREVFLFRIACADCGASFGNQPIRFSKAGEEANTQAKQTLRAVLYEQELRSVRQTAIRQASEHLNLCPICRRLVCNGCFLICDELDMCKSCAQALQQTGQPVSPAIIDAAL